MKPENNGSPTKPNAEYWRARVEELECHLTETRVLLMRLAETLPIEYLPQLKLSVAEFVSSEASQPNLASEGTSAPPQGAEQTK